MLLLPFLIIDNYSTLSYSATETKLLIKNIVIAKENNLAEYYHLYMNAFINSLSFVKQYQGKGYLAEWIDSIQLTEDSYFFKIEIITDNPSNREVIATYQVTEVF